MAHADLMKPDYARNMRLLGHSDQDGRADGCQIMVIDGYAYIGHMFSAGFSVVDVRDPRNPKTVNYIPAPPGTWSIHLQAHEDLLLIINNMNLYSDQALQDEATYYSGSMAEKTKHARGYSAGIRVFDISDRSNPREIGFMPVDGVGVHRIWYVGGRWAYASALLDGFTDYIMITIDLADPTKPTLAGPNWLPGMNKAAGEVPNWPLPVGRLGLHHPIIHGDIAYCSWRDACLAVVDVSDRTAPKLIVHKTWAPPLGGGTHNALPLPNRELLIVVDETVLDNREDGEKPIWIFDNRVKSNPISISTLPEPNDADYLKVGGHFGPHNVYENRPDNFVSEDLIFATYQNAGVRVYDIRNKWQPVEVGACVPPPPTKMVDPRPNRPKVLHSADVFVDKNGIVYSSDFNVGLYIMEYKG